MKTIADIAKMAGVAKSTVSRYLNNGYVSDKTREKIEKIIRETGYQPNAFAQSLKARKTNLIGVIIPRLDSFATSKTLIGIDGFLKKRGYQLLISNSNQSYEEELRAIYDLVNQKVAGLLILATKVTSTYGEIISKYGTPVVFIGQELEGEYCVIHNDYQAGFELADQLYGCGYRRFLYVGVAVEDISVGYLRRDGFGNRLHQEQGVEVTYIETDFSMKSAQQVAKEILPTIKEEIVVCATDTIALGFLKIAQELEMVIPEQLSIAGFGGHSMTEFVTPAITTVQYEYEQAGVSAAKKLLHQIEGIETAKKEIINTTVILRGSVYRKA